MWRDVPWKLQFARCLSLHSSESLYMALSWPLLHIGQVFSQVWCSPYLATQFGFFKLRMFPGLQSKVQVSTFYLCTLKVGSKCTWIALTSSTVKPPVRLHPLCVALRLVIVLHGDDIAIKCTMTEWLKKLKQNLATPSFSNYLPASGCLVRQSSGHENRFQVEAYKIIPCTKARREMEWHESLLWRYCLIIGFDAWSAFVCQFLNWQKTPNLDSLLHFPKQICYWKVWWTKKRKIYIAFLWLESRIRRLKVFETSPSNVTCFVYTTCDCKISPCLCYKVKHRLLPSNIFGLFRSTPFGYNLMNSDFHIHTFSLSRFSPLVLDLGPYLRSKLWPTSAYSNNIWLEHTQKRPREPGVKLRLYRDRQLCEVCLQCCYNFRHI